MQWDEYWKEIDRPSWPEYTSIRIKWFISIVKNRLLKEISSSATVVEIGAGKGWVTAHLSPLFIGGKYICTDVAEEALLCISELKLPNVITKLACEKTGLNICADLVICGDVYEHVRERKSFLDNIYEIMKPGGHLLISTPNLYIPMIVFNRSLGKEATGQPYDRPVSRKRLHRDIVDAGFEIKEIELKSAMKKPKLSTSSIYKTIVLKISVKMIGLILGLLQIDQREAILVHAQKPYTTEKD